MWRYSLFDYPMDGSEGDLETWCARLAEEGWQLWDAGIGAVIDVNGREVRRLSLRRWRANGRLQPAGTCRTAAGPSPSGGHADRAGGTGRRAAQQ